MHITRKDFVMSGAALAAASCAFPFPGFAQPARKQRNYLDVTWWDPYVENITDVDTYLRRKFRQDVTDKTTGIGIAEIRKELFDLVKTSKAAGDPWRITKAKCFAHQIRRQSIDVSPLDWFPAIAIWNRDARPFYNGGVLWRRRDEVNRQSISKEIRDEWESLKKSGNWWLGQDFCHSVPPRRLSLTAEFSLGPIYFATFVKRPSFNLVITTCLVTSITPPSGIANSNIYIMGQETSVSSRDLLTNGIGTPIWISVHLADKLSNFRNRILN